MAIRIGEDGTIIRGDEVIESNGTVIGEDGTIVSSNIASSPAPQPIRSYHAAPVSPLENRTPVRPEPEVQETPRQQVNSISPASARSIADLEYDLKIAEGHAKGAEPKSAVGAAIAMALLGILIHPVLFVGTLVAGVVAFMGYSKKSQYEEEAKRLQNEISRLRRS